jgi:hypothetical protein
MVKDTSAGRVAADSDDTTPATRGSKTWCPEAIVTAGQARVEARYCPSSRTQHTDVPERDERTVSPGYILSREIVRVEQATDEFCKSLQVGHVEGKSEYFLDEEGLIFRKRVSGDHQPGQTCKLRKKRGRNTMIGIQMFHCSL